MDQMYLHGGAEKILSQKINYLIHNFGHEIHLITSEQKNNTPVYNLDSKLIWTDLKLNYNRKLSYFHPYNLLKTSFHFWKLKQEIKRIKPDIIVSVSLSPDQYFLPFLSKNIPKIKEFHSSRFNNKSVSWLKEKLESTLEKYNVLVVLNKTEKKYYQNNRIEIIANFADLRLIEKDNVFKEKTILAAGRIARVKQFDHLIQAWGIIASDFPEWQVKIFGNGDEILSSKLLQLIQKMDVPNIRLMGETEHLDQEMQKASIFAMTSATECFPMVLLEAQSAGLAIVSYDCPYGPRNIIEDTIDGILTPVNEINQFAKKLKELILDDKARQSIGIAAKQNGMRFSKEKIMKQWDDLFIKLINNK
jgi:glycosyltransferase involved in cell wall biosynthesis